jgi:Flp pilus assembly protein TadG
MCPAEAPVRPPAWRPPLRRLVQLDAADGDRGSYTLELVLWTPVLALVLLMVVALGRIATARDDATEAARDAARAASLQTTLTAARDAARTAAQQSFSDAGVSCTHLAITVTGSITPGALITARVACTAQLGDLAIPGLPGAETLASTSTAPIEITRSGAQR